MNAVKLCKKTECLVGNITVSTRKVSWWKIADLLSRNYLGVNVWLQSLNLTDAAKAKSADIFSKMNSSDNIT